MLKKLSRSTTLGVALALVALAASFAVSPKAFAQSGQSDSTLEIRLRTRLTGPPLNGQTPHGKAEFEQEDSGRKFSVEVEDVSLPNGTILVVGVNGTRVGTIKIQSGDGTLLLVNGHAPNVTKGSKVVIRAAGNSIMSGTF
jgi:hypothetical protein